MGEVPKQALPDRMAQAAHALAVELMADVSITGRADHERAKGIIQRLSGSDAMMEVWRTLARRDQISGAFIHGRPVSDDQRVADALKLFRMTCMAAVWRFETQTSNDLDAIYSRRCMIAHAAAEFAPDLSNQLLERAEILREPPDYRLRVGRSRTSPELKGLVITLTRVCQWIFGSEMHGVVARLVGVALEQPDLDKIKVREMMKSQGGVSTVPDSR